MELDMATFQARLYSRRQELLDEMSDSADAEQVVELDQTRVGRLSRMDALQSQAMAADVARRRTAELQRIAAALRRIDAGEYGLCLTCGEPIAPARLELDPATSQCIRCASLDELGEEPG